MKNRTNVRWLTQIALLAAILLVLNYTPLGYLQVGPLSASLLTVYSTLARTWKLVVRSADPRVRSWGATIISSEPSRRLFCAATGIARDNASTTEVM